MLRPTGWRPKSSSRAATRGRDYLKESDDILKNAAKKCPALATTIEIWGDITFDYESTDTADVTKTPTPGLGGRFMRIKQGTFSHLPDLSDDEIKAQIQYAIDNDWSVSIEYTDDPHPRNVYWEMFGLPMFDMKDASRAFIEVDKAREAFPNHYIKVNAYNARYTKQTTALSFIVHRPKVEPGFRLERTETSDRRVNCQLYAYPADHPHGTRYQSNGQDGVQPD